ncbi:MULTISPECIES: hypothetical protein [unclassified Streptomyces]|uniref:hypothetical protein n=1 Tax=unclassified Streptomyces TaxID=2593676 RepID=UPI0024A87823|nr:MULTISPECIES: hypothetical protein [unclassified Streptomyces]
MTSLRLPPVSRTASGRLRRPGRKRGKADEERVHEKNGKVLLYVVLLVLAAWRGYVLAD